MQLPSILTSHNSPSFVQYNAWRAESGLPESPEVELRRFRNELLESSGLELYHIHPKGSGRPEGNIVIRTFRPNRNIRQYLEDGLAWAGRLGVEANKGTRIRGLGRSATCVVFDALWSDEIQPIETSVTLYGKRLFNELEAAGLVAYKYGFDGTCQGDTMERGLALGVRPIA